MKKLYLFLFLILNTKTLFATGLPVFDATAATNFVLSIQAMEQMIKHNVEMAKNVGNGNFTPSTINWMASWWEKCGGGKYVLPDWFPHPKLNICADPNKTLELGVDWYKKEFLVLKSDDLIVAKQKSKNQENAIVKIRAFALAKSSLDMQRGEEDQKAVEQFQKGLAEANDQVKIQKVQTQILIQMLAQLQKINQQQAHIIQIMAIRD